jgi:hypothetical protein
MSETPGWIPFPLYLAQQHSSQGQRGDALAFHPSAPVSELHTMFLFKLQIIHLHKNSEPCHLYEDFTEETLFLSEQLKIPQLVLSFLSPFPIYPFLYVSPSPSFPS